jgi:hypothetical protein
MSEVKTTVNLPSDFSLNVKVSEAEMPGFIKKDTGSRTLLRGKTVPWKSH